jgi:ER membrane protein complex subunit 1
LPPNVFVKPTDASVVFKYMNPNMVFFIACETSGGLGISGVDTVTGSLVYSSVVNGATCDPVPHGVHMDNWLVLHYYSIEFDRFEVAVVDLFEQRGDVSMREILTYEKNLGEKSAFDLPVDPIAVAQQYVFPYGAISAVSVTTTSGGITPRQILFATKSGQLIAIKKDIWLNPRRPGGDTSNTPPRLIANPEEGLPPYNATLPVIPTDTLSHMHMLDGIRLVVTLPTHLESTSIAVVFGKDIFCAPVYIGNAPYDVLPPFFNYWLLYVSGGSLLGAVIVTAGLAKRKALMDKWK